ncbi:MAG: hypothetical protein WC637_00125 [Victivallales bacterium]|jgi:hypothetical protein
MSRPRDSRRKEAIIREYQRHLAIYGYGKFAEITKAVGLHSNHGSYAARVVQKWKEEQQERGQLRECLCCDDHFISAGRHHRLCDRCRGIEGEYTAPFSVSPAIHFAAQGRY